jgi:fructoselysine-6-P-deglycase FrlB-like protein
MNSINAMQKEISYQIDELPKLNLPKQVDLDNFLIVGAGDSYVAALITQFLSNYKAICCTPMEIVNNPKILKNHRLYIVSVSGNTKSNILAAKISRKQKIQTTAITANPESILAKNCDEIIELRYKSTGIPTSGTISFTSSLLCCLSLIGKINLLDLTWIYRQTNNEVENIIYSTLKKASSYVFLGEGILFPAAIYGSLKINEVFGIRSFAYHFEEFCHSPIFSIKKNDKMIILGNKEYDNTSDQKLNKKLKKLGIDSTFVECTTSKSNIKKMHVIETLLKSIIFLQLYVVKQAARKRVKNCFFLKNKDLLKLSSTSIYGDII